MAEGVAEVDGGLISWEAAGEGPAVTFLHPGLWDRRTWDDQFVRFSKTYRVVRYDTRGYGRSSRPQPGGPYSHVRDLMSVLDGAEIDRTALVGCSMGGRIALDAALTHPERVTALVLAATSVGGFRESDEEAEQYADLEREIEEASEAGDAERALELELRVWATALGTDDPAGARIREIAFDNLHVITMDESGVERIDDAFERLGEISVPTLVLPADRDPHAFQRLSAEVAERIPNARLVRIPETDHVINMRRPAEFNRVVLGFLGEVL
jgi:3-oxoadipate enol-lactonase